MKSSIVRVKKWASRPAFCWVVVWRQGGKRCTRSFSDQRAAKSFAHEKGIELTNEARRHEGITDAERRAVHMARELEERLAEGGVKGFSLSAAIEDYAKRLQSLMNSISVLKAVEEMVALREAEGRSKAHLTDLKHRLMRFANAHKGRLVASFTTRDIDAWLMALKCAPQSKANFRRGVHNLFAWCAARGYAISNPVTQAAKVKVPAGTIGILTTGEAHRLLLACHASILPAVAIGLFAGLRRAEVNRLSWEEVDFHGGHIEVKSDKSKSGKRRLVEISDNLRQWLAPYRQLSGPVRPSRGTYQQLFTDAVKASGIERWPNNGLRHTYASCHLAHYQDAGRTALQLGHMGSQMVFGHYRELVRRADAAAFWQIFPPERGRESKVIAMRKEAA